MRVYVLNCGTLLFRVSYSVYSPAQCDMKPERVTMQRSATSTKQVLLDWCKRRVSGYKVSRSTLYYYRLLLLLLQAPLGVRSAKHDISLHSPEWTILSHRRLLHLFKERLQDFRSCWMVFIHVL